MTPEDLLIERLLGPRCKRPNCNHNNCPFDENGMCVAHCDCSKANGGEDKPSAFGTGSVWMYFPSKNQRSD